ENLSSMEKEELLKEHEKQYHAAFHKTSDYANMEGQLAPIIMQTLYGDESTVNPKVKFNQPPMGIASEYGERVPEFNYDTDELTRRALIKKHGFEAKRTWNPIVHAGFTGNMLSTGARQWIPPLNLNIYNPKRFYDPKAQEKAATSLEEYRSKKQKNYDDWLEGYEIYNTADQPFLSQLVGDAAYGAANIVAAPSRMFMGQGAKAIGLKSIGKHLIDTAAFTGITTPRNFLSKFGVAGLIEGSGFGLSVPVDPSLPLKDQAYLKTLQGLGYGAIGLGGQLGMTALTTQGQKILTQKLRKEAGGTLPITPKVPTPVLYNQRSWFEDLKAWRTGRLHVGESTSAQRQLQAWEESMLANYRRMNYDASGSYNEIPGGKPFKDALNFFLDAHNESWNKVAAKYDEVEMAGNIFTRNSGYQSHLKGLRQELFDKGYLAPENPVSHALALMQSYVKEAPSYPSGKKDFAFSGRALNNIYKGLNNIMSQPGTDPASRNAIRLMKHRLMDYMTNGSNFFMSSRSPNAPNLVQKFIEATEAANTHYKKFDNSATVSRYINYLSGNNFGDEAEYTIADVSRSMFGSAALDFREVPKHRAIDQLLGAFDVDTSQYTPQQLNSQGVQDYINMRQAQREMMRKSLANEAFSNFTDSFDRQRWIGAVEHINKRIIGGSDGEIYDNVFKAETKQQLKDFAKVYDMVNDPDFSGRTALSAEVYTDIRTTRALPNTPILKRFAIPINDPKKLVYPNIFRSEKGTPSPSTSPLAPGGILPPLLHRELGFGDDTLERGESFKRQHQREKERKIIEAKRAEKRRQKEAAFEKRMEEHRKRIRKMRAKLANK
ncbi:MAG: hypothetical protein U9P00_09120, partial [Pseudomonadota bacterium]|nr:hypothetical protein [Pseudomonadota bacterium]